MPEFTITRWPVQRIWPMFPPSPLKWLVYKAVTADARQRAKAMDTMAADFALEMERNFLFGPRVVEEKSDAKPDAGARENG